ncbi:hypothetical protein SO802_006191 [Lithocarpus litseifolius]|uniref:Reverse transcriptase zinc-binding domain-containing protein n=1 Tax=Lithocarpus litseifolius TaxID=425828 RepID=A0AAW2DN64_9ROSI
MSSQEIVNRSLRWQVGNGKRIRIWEDKWIPTPSTFRINSPSNHLPREALVSSLINNRSATWKSKVVKHVFLQHEADAILSIPLSQYLPEDKLVWVGTQNGMFTVLSAYKLAMESLLGPHNAGNSNQGLKPLWKRIWSVNVPSKIKCFAWRVCKRIPPTKATLCHRPIISDPVCEVCGLAAETTGHLLWESNKAKEIWNEVSLNLEGLGHGCEDFTDILWKFIEIEPSSPMNLELFITICWGIWLNRNEVRNGEPVKSGGEIVRRALYLVDEFFPANLPAQNKASAKEVKWSALPRNKLKINVDGAIFKNVREAGVGVIIRDSQGQVVATQSKKIPFPIGAIEAEALAVESGILFASNLGMTEVI